MSGAVRDLDNAGTIVVVGIVSVNAGGTSVGCISNNRSGILEVVTDQMHTRVGAIIKEVIGVTNSANGCRAVVSDRVLMLSAVQDPR